MCHEIAVHRLCIITTLLHFSQSFNSVDHLSCLVCLSDKSPPAHGVDKYLSI